MNQVSPSAVLLSTAFFGPVSYFETLLRAEEVYIEKHENFVRQTFRNRCVILSANGPLPLIVPVENSRKPAQKITGVRIAYHTRWQPHLWHSITSAYRKSPFFEFYAGDIEPFFRKRYTFLFDLNTDITNQVLECLGARKELNYSTAFEKAGKPLINYRQKFSPKINLPLLDPDYRPVKYTQVFEHKFPFVPDLSILDLLFCNGPASTACLSPSSGKG